MQSVSAIANERVSEQMSERAATVIIVEDEKLMIVTIRIVEVPYVPEIDRVEVASLGQGFWQITVQYGFKDEPDLPAALALCAHFELQFDMMDTSFFLGRETLIAGFGKGMSYWRVLLFAAMFRNASSLTAFFKIPSNRMVELGSQIVMQAIRLA